MKHVVQFSGGLCSFFAAQRVCSLVGSGNVTLLFADTLIESPGLYRFLEASAKYLRLPLTRIADGRTPWQVFKDEGIKGFLGNSRVDICSRVLKRDLCRKWVEANCDVRDTILYVGITWDEGRIETIKKRWKPWVVCAPMCDPPYETRGSLIQKAKKMGLPLSEAYADGFPHDNCGGGCVKAGQAHFAKLLQIRPAVYAEWERNEEDVRQHIGEDVSILKDRRGGKTKPLTLAAFRKRLQCGYEFDQHEWGGCGCGV